MENKRLYSRIMLNMECYLFYSNSATKTLGILRDISPSGARIDIHDKSLKSFSSPRRNLHVVVKGISIPVDSVRYMYMEDRVLIGVSFSNIMNEADFKKIVGDKFTQLKNTGIITFECKTDIIDLSFFDTLQQLMRLFLVVDVSYRIYAEVHKKTHGGEIVLPPTSLKYLRSSSPLKGAMNTVSEVVDIARTADDIIKNRKENKQIKQEDVKQHKEKTKQEFALTQKTESEAFIKMHTKHLDVYNAYTESRSRTVALNKEEVNLLKERIGLFSAAFNVAKEAKEIFGPESEELNLVRTRLIPDLSTLLSKSPLNVSLTYESNLMENE